MKKFTTIMSIINILLLINSTRIITTTFIKNGLTEGNIYILLLVILHAFVVYQYFMLNYHKK